jgi:hypothetical protein
VRPTNSLQVGAKYLGCVVCRFHVAAGAGRAPCQKPVSIKLQKWFLFSTGRLNFGFITEGKLTAVLITPSSWGSQLACQHRTISESSSSSLLSALGKKRACGVIVGRPTHPLTNGPGLEQRVCLVQVCVAVVDATTGGVYIAFAQVSSHATGIGPE